MTAGDRDHVMAMDFPTRIARRLLRGLGLARARDVEAARRVAAARARADVQAKLGRERAASAARLRALQARFDARHEQDVANHAERSTLRKALAYHWERLNHLEALFGGHAERLAKQLEIAIAARPDEPVSASAPAPAEMVQATVAGATWCMPAAHERRPAGKLTTERCLPLDELAATRQFVVGGVMLDIGAGFGGTAIPRALLGDFRRIHAVEWHDVSYRALAVNVAASRVRDIVRADHVCLGPAVDDAGVPTSAPRSSLNAWVTQTEVPVQEVRFIRVGGHAATHDILRDGVGLFPGRDVVWQLDLAPSSALLTTEGLAPLARVAAAHFTHFKELGRFPAEPWRKTAELKRLFKEPDGAKPSGLLLFNLR